MIALKFMDRPWIQSVIKIFQLFKERSIAILYNKIQVELRFLIASKKSKCYSMVNIQAKAMKQFINNL